MNILFSVFIFISSALLLYVGGKGIVKNTISLSRALHVREFVLAFFVMAVASSLPNLFVGITSALDGIPELSLGDIFGNNIIALTLAVSCAIFFSPKKEISSGGRTVEITSFFTFITAILPVVLLGDGILSRIDGIILIGLFVFYSYWLLGRHDKFTKVLVHENHKKTGHILSHLVSTLGSVLLVLLNVLLMIVCAFGIVFSASFFAEYFGITLAIVGLLITGLGNALPEIYFAVISAKKNETSLILGGLMGSVIVPSTLILGLVTLIQPITISSDGAILSSRIFVIISAVLFFIFAKTKNKITLEESLILLGLYILFIWNTLK